MNRHYLHLPSLLLAQSPLLLHHRKVVPESLTTLPRRDHTHGVGDLLSTARTLALSLWAAFLALVCLSLSLRLLGGVSGVYSLLPGDIVI